MTINRNDYKYLYELLIYLKNGDYSDNDYHLEMISHLELLIARLDEQRDAKNKINSKRVAEKRKLDKNYARSFKDKRN